MDVPPLVRDRLEGKSALTRIDLGGEDAVFVTPTRTLVYRGEGLLSDESVAAYPHDVERLDVSEGRRKTTFEFAYVDTAGSFTVPAGHADDVLVPVFEGVLAAGGVTEADEEVREVYRFSELTLVVTDGRLLKHVGDALWDDDFEDYPFEDVTDLRAEEGSVATELVVELAERPHRLKVPAEKGERVRRALEAAVLERHGVNSLSALREKQGVVDEPSASRAEAFAESGIEPLVGDDAGDDAGDDNAADAEPAAAGAPGSAAEPAARTAGDEEVAEADAETAGAPADDDPFRAGGATASDVEVAADGDLAVLERLAALEAAVDRQSELLEAQRTTIETLVDELRRGR